jgi:hypothetical protein
MWLAGLHLIFTTGVPTLDIRDLCQFAHEMGREHAALYREAFGSPIGPANCGNWDSAGLEAAALQVRRQFRIELNAEEYEPFRQAYRLSLFGGC